MNKNLLIIIVTMLTGNVFALSLGDTLTSNTLKAQTTTTSTIKLSTQTASHTEYTINEASGKTIALVNKQNIVYGFKWSNSSPDITTMLGKFKPEYDLAHATPNKFNHRMMRINTPHLMVNQFGLPNSRFQGSMYAKDLVPN